MIDGLHRLVARFPVFIKIVRGKEKLFEKEKNCLKFPPQVVHFSFTQVAFIKTKLSSSASTTLLCLAHFHKSFHHKFSTIFSSTFSLLHSRSSCTICLRNQTAIASAVYSHFPLFLWRRSWQSWGKLKFICVLRLTLKLHSLSFHWNWFGILSAMAMECITSHLMA